MIDIEQIELGKEEEWIIDHYDEDIRMYTDDEGISYPELTDFILTGIFDFCGCGSPEGAVKFIQDSLEHIELRNEALQIRGAEGDKVWEKIKEQEISNFGSLGCATFFYYWATNEDLIDHGGSVPGWLTDKGKIVLNLCKAVLKLEQEV